MVRQRNLWVTPAVALLVTFAAWTLKAQEGQAPTTPTTGQKIKDSVGSAVNTIKKEAAVAGEAIKEQFEKAKGAVRSFGIESRVYARLHWDKALASAKIDLSAPRPGVITLTGTVGDARAKARALDLTAETVGVDEVVDHLTILTTTDAATPARP